MWRRGMFTALAGALVLAALGGSALWSKAHDRPASSRIVPPTRDQCRDDRALEPRQRAVCEGVWIRPARRGFVPQGLVVEGGLAILSGYREARPGHRFCQLVVADADTGRTRVVLRHLSSTIGATRVECRHGGGLTAGPEGLWLAQSSRLWLLDVAALQRGDDPVRRVWEIRGPVRGSALARRPGAIGLVGWADHRRQRVFWVRIDRLLTAGVGAVDLTAGSGVAVPIAHRQVPSRVQGAAWGPGGLWLTRSTTYCGLLVRPDGVALRFLPGAEGIAFDGRRRLWLISESGAGAYQRQGEGRPAVPTLLSLRPRDLAPDDVPNCGWG